MAVNHILRRKNVDQSVYELAKERLHHTYDLFDTVVVAFSGGKDSTAMLNVTLEVARERGRLPLLAQFHDEECIPIETVDYVRRVSQDPDIRLRWLCLPVKHRNACSRKDPYWYPWDPRCPEKWIRELPPEAITELDGFEFGKHSTVDVEGLSFRPQQYGEVGMLLGVRAEESPTRRWAVSRKVIDNYIIHSSEAGSVGNIYKVYPIYDWRTVDVWTAPKLKGWDYNAAYDLMDKFGLSPTDQRCAPPFGEQPMRNLAMFKTCFPEIWERMYNRVPGAATAARYSMTKLYSFGDRPERPEGMSWQDFVLQLLEKFEPDVKALSGKRLHEIVRRHYRKTVEPILYGAPHPLTGVSWKFVIGIAARGDLKGRRQEYNEIAGRSEAELRAKYEAVRAEEGL